VRATDFDPSSILNLYVFLSSREDVPHPGNCVLHQVFVERVRELQPNDERCGSYVVIIVIHQGHLALEITDIVLEALSGLYLDCKEVIVVPLELLPRSVLVIESLVHLFEAPS